MTALVEEFLRINEPAQFAIRRFPTEPLTVNGITIPAGDTVMLCLAAANRDPHHFPHPDTISPLTINPDTVPSDAVHSDAVQSDAAQLRVPTPARLNTAHVDTAPQTSRHVSFGHGIHYCLGAALVRLETRIALWTLIHHHPHLNLAINPGQVPWRSGFRRRAPHALPLTTKPIPTNNTH